MMKSNVTRRTFVKAAAATMAVPYIYSSAQAKAEDANSKLTIAAIGVGGSNGRYNRGGKVGRNAAALGQTIAVCDVDQKHNEEYNASVGDGKLEMFQDYRKMFEKVKPDIVTIGTPDHWHVPIAIAAMQNGADVYCEKPLTLTIDEGKTCCKVAKETGRVFQVGTQQRSECNRRFLDAIAIVQLGILGDKVDANVAIGGAPAGGPFPVTEVPAELDWDMWLGPAPKKGYSVERRKMFRWFFEYSGGKMTDWGAHHIDISQWALSPDAGPVSVSGTGEFPEGVYPENFNFDAFLDGNATLPDSYNTATQFDIDLKFANGSTLNVNNNYTSEDGKTSFPNGILFTGEKGRIFVNRGKLVGSPVENLTDAQKAAIDVKVAELYGGPVTGHMQNFFDCVKDRDRLPVSDVFSHHRTMNSCHLCNINLMLGRDLTWDPVKEEFPGDAEANALLKREPRAPYAQELKA